MAAQRGLGKGLDALLGGRDSEAKSEKITQKDVQKISLDNVEPNPNQPRKDFSEETLQELAASIKSNGVIQPILVRKSPSGKPGKYQLIAGERRLRASKIAGLKVVPALIGDYSDEESLTIAIIENLQREDLNPMDEAVGLKELQDRLSLSQETLAEKIGKSRPAVANALRLLQLPDIFQNDLRTGSLSAGHARQLLAVSDAQTQQELRDKILEEELSVRDAEKMAAHWRTHGVLPDNGVAPKPKKKSAIIGEKEKDPVLDDYEQQLNQGTNLKFSIKGAQEKGKMVVSFSSKEQLEELMAAFGVQA